MSTTTLVNTGAGLTQTPYQINVDQTLKASKALLNHVREQTKKLQELSSKKNLLASAKASDSEDDDAEDTPIWLTLTTKQHIVDKQRLLPSKIKVPHSLNKSENLSICLITADPQRAFKNAVADPSFPPHLSSRIDKIIGFSKLKARYHSFEAKRQLRDEFDIFLADDRIVTRLVGELGKTFYKGSTKRPIPVNLAQTEKDENGKRVKATLPRKTNPKDDKAALVASPTIVAAEIERAMNCVPVSLKPGTNVSVRIGLASFTPAQLSDNMKVAAEAIIKKHVVKGWRNVKSILVKSPTSTALPIWLAEDMWVDEERIIKEELIKAEVEKKERKRKRNPNSSKGPQVGERKKVKVEEMLEEELAMGTKRKASLAAQKAQAFKESAKDIAISA
jgi:ribosome biogenesis protein UTP30